MRKYLYLITECERHPDNAGLLEVTETRKTPSSKNEETVHQMADWSGETAPTDDDRWVRKLVSCGHADFEDGEDYDERIAEVGERKLGEIDERHKIKAGISDKGAEDLE